MTRVLRRLGAATLVLVLVAVGAAGWWVRSGATLLTVVRTDDASSAWTPDKPLFVLLLGDDRRGGIGCGCTDAVHLVGVPAGGGSAVILNIPRDLRVDIPGYGMDRVNVAYQRGGAKLAAETVGRLVGVSVSYALVTSFGGLVDMVDALGGVPIDVPMAIRDPNVGLFVNPGPQVFDGAAALAFARSRKTFPDSDFTRTANQARLILAALAKLRAEGTSPADELRYLTVLLRNVAVQGAGTADLVRLGRVALSIDPASVRSVVVPGTGVMIGGASMVQATAGAAGLFADLADDARLQNH